jgi:hypothetical protein
MAIAAYGPTVASHDAFGKVLRSEGEDNIVITSSYAKNGWSTNSPEAFDEPLSAAHVLAFGAFFNVA